MNSELDKLRKEMTREEFIEYIDKQMKSNRSSSLCPDKQYNLLKYCKGYNCLNCWREAVKDIQFKDDIEAIEEVLTEGHKEELSTIKDSGQRTQFITGAVRDLQENKGRCDLLALEPVYMLLGTVELEEIKNYIEKGDISCLLRCLEYFADRYYGDFSTMFLEVAKHYEEGAKKYEINNWCKGIPTHSYIDSAIRHYLKHRRGDKDEAHDRSFVWNIMCCIWTHINKPEMRDIMPKVQSHE
jgi:predicted transcriptional regulator with HTH domain